MNSYEQRHLKMSFRASFLLSTLVLTYITHIDVIYIYLENTASLSIIAVSCEQTNLLIYYSNGIFSGIVISSLNILMKE